MAPTAPSAGLHHITAICGDPRDNLSFYSGVLGMRLVKKTVNFDAPQTWHLYYGDERGRPGTALTFFPFADAPPGREGAGEPADIAFAVPPASLSFWAERLASCGVAFEHRTRFGDERLAFRDPHGLKLSLVGAGWAATLDGWQAQGDDAPPAEHAVRGFFGVEVKVAEAEPSARVLTQALGFEQVAEEGDTLRFQAGAGAGLGAVVDVRLVAPQPARQGVGSIHHIAFRARDDDHEMALRTALAELGIGATEQIDRHYFRSVYFREPGGSLFELATDAPGFAVDESLEALGGKLMLPAQLEPRRDEIEAALPPLR